MLTAEEKLLTAYDESGHAVVSMKTHASDPIHKATIIPRGRALGLTASLPETDRHNYTRDWLIGRLAMCYGGRAAEEITFGKGAVTTGAGGDIQQATALARRMVMEYGMSEAVGLMAVGDRKKEVFINREFGSRRERYQRNIKIIDLEVKLFFDNQL